MSTLSPPPPNEDGNYTTTTTTTTHVVHWVIVLTPTVVGKELAQTDAEPHRLEIQTLTSTLQRLGSKSACESKFRHFDPSGGLAATAIDALNSMIDVLQRKATPGHFESQEHMLWRINKATDNQKRPS